MDEKTPLSIALENARRKVISSFNEVITQTKLPAFLMEGIALEILADLRDRKAIELMLDSKAESEESDG